MPRFSTAPLSAVVANRYLIHGSTTTLVLEDGTEVLVDTEDVPRLRATTWYAIVSRESKNHARRYVRGNNVALHRVVMDAPDGVYVDHINHDTLDNRKANLRLVAAQENCMNRDGAYMTSQTNVRGVSTHKTNDGALMYVFRCHGVTCKDATYFPHTEHGLEQARTYAEAHYAGTPPPAWTLERPPIRHPNRKPAKLSNDDVRAIRQASAAGETQASIAARFGVAGSLVSLIANRKRRSAVPD